MITGKYLRGTVTPVTPNSCNPVEFKYLKLIFLFLFRERCNQEVDQPPRLFC